MAWWLANLALVGGGAMTDRQPRERRDREAVLNAQICHIVREKRLDLGLLQA